MNLARSINRDFLTRWNPLDDPKQRLAVALYREAMSVNSIPYKFLGFFKIINILYKNGPDQKAWIKATLPSLTESYLQDRLRLCQMLSRMSRHICTNQVAALLHMHSRTH